MLLYPLGGALDEALTHKISVVQVAIGYIIACISALLGSLEAISKCKKLTLSKIPSLSTHRQDGALISQEEVRYVFEPSPRR